MTIFVHYWQLMKKKICIIIPSYKDEGVLPFVVRNVFNTCLTLSNYDFSFVVIEDGSDTIKISDLGGITSCYLLRHPINLGQGAALQTGFEFCKRSLKPDFVVTMDADGQHSAEDLDLFIKAIDRPNNPPDIVFGNRFGRQSNIPSSRQAILKLAVRFERRLTGLKLNDAHNGYRIFNNKVLGQIHLTQNRMAHATQFKQLVAERNFTYSEVPMKIVYTKESLAKGQKNSGSLIILRDLIKSYIFER